MMGNGIRVLFLLCCCVGLGCDFGDLPDEVDGGLLPDGVSGDEPCAPGVGPLRGTCLETLGEPCWTPVGACVIGSVSSGVGLVFDSGHRVEFKSDPNDSQALNISALGPAGDVCFRGKSQLNADGTGRVQFLTGLGGDSVLEGTLVSASTGAVYVECPLSTWTVPPAEIGGVEQCLYGRTGGICDFAQATALFREGGGEGQGGCGGAQDCLPGTQCCAVQGGASYCAPVCL